MNSDELQPIRNHANLGMGERTAAYLSMEITKDGAPILTCAFTHPCLVGDMLSLITNVLLEHNKKRLPPFEWKNGEELNQLHIVPK